MTKKLQIRNSTAEFLTFASQNEGNSIEVRFEDETLWDWGGNAVGKNLNKGNVKTV